MFFRHESWVLWTQMTAQWCNFLNRLKNTKSAWFRFTAYFGLEPFFQWFVISNLCFFKLSEMKLSPVNWGLTV